jgi:hypothetical protein
LAPFGFQITKKVTWRGNDELFSNVYHYQMGASLSESEGDAMLQALVAAEKPAFGTNVTFVQGRAFGPTNVGKAGNLMVAVRDFTGAGTQSGLSDMPRELTVVVDNFIGRGPAGRKQFLRKYLHICKCSSGDISDQGAYGNNQLGANLLTLGQQYANRIKTITASSNQWQLCSPQGKLWNNIGDNWRTLPYAHVRQFRQ